MKSLTTRLIAAAVLALLSLLALAGAAKGPTLKPDKLIILSTTDVKGETSPCG